MSTEEGIRKTKVQLELKLTRDVKGKRKNFHNYTGSKSKAEENVGLVLNRGDLVIKDMEEVEIFKVFLLFFSLVRCAL